MIRSLCDEGWKIWELVDIFVSQQRGEFIQRLTGPGPAMLHSVEVNANWTCSQLSGKSDESLIYFPFALDDYYDNWMTLLSANIRRGFNH